MSNELTGKTSIAGMDACELSQRIHDRAISCREVMAAYLKQIERLNPRVNAIVSLRHPVELLREPQTADDLLARRSIAWLDARFSACGQGPRSY